MEKYIEVTLSKQVDRYHLKDMPVDDFLEAFFLLQEKPLGVKDISKEEYESHPDRQFFLTFNIEDRYIVEHYTAVHESEEHRQNWITFVKLEKIDAL